MNNDSMIHVVKGLTILGYTGGIGNNGLITSKNVNSACIHGFQGTELKLRRWVEHSIEKVVVFNTLLGLTGGIGNKRVITRDSHVSESRCLL